jgi:hypothetical protein
VVFALLLLPRPALVFVRAETLRRSLERLAAKRVGATAGRDNSLLTAHRDAALVAAVARYVWPRPNCLHRSLVLNSVLRAQGIPSSIRYGVRRNDGRFEAHAWVEHDGEPLTEPGEVHREYEPLRAVTELSRGAKP